MSEALVTAMPIVVPEMVPRGRLSTPPEMLEVDTTVIPTLAFPKPPAVMVPLLSTPPEMSEPLTTWMPVVVAEMIPPA